MKNNYILNIDKKLKSAALLASICGSLLLPSVANAFPVYAQQAYENPREATGRIVCANCHLAQNQLKLKYLKEFYQILFLKLSLRFHTILQ